MPLSFPLSESVARPHVAPPLSSLTRLLLTLLTGSLLSFFPGEGILLLEVGLVGLVLSLSLLLLDVGSLDKEEVRRDVVDCTEEGTDFTEAGRERLLLVEPGEIIFCDSLLLFSLLALLCEEEEEEGEVGLVGELDLGEVAGFDAVDLAILDLDPNRNNDREGDADFSGLELFDVKLLDGSALGLFDDEAGLFDVDSGLFDVELGVFELEVGLFDVDDDDGGAAAEEEEEDDDLLDGLAKRLSLDEVRTGTGGLIPDLNGSLLFVFAGGVEGEGVSLATCGGGCGDSGSGITFSTTGSSSGESP